VSAPLGEPVRDVDPPTPHSWDAWLGRTEVRDETLAAAPLASMSATLDRDDPPPVAGTEVPPLWHWGYFTPLARESEIGPDGHATRGGFLPPVTPPRRMWAGGRLTFDAPLAVGDAVTRTSRIASIDAKSGRSGTLVFVAVHHDYLTVRGRAIHEEHDIVFRDAPAPGASAPAPPRGREDEDYAREIAPDPVLLFRYSAITFNGHRIHYDREYATKVEGYPGLVVHGPLIATLLVDLLRRERPTARLRQFDFRAVSPLFDVHRFRVCGRDEGGGRHALWARSHEGALAMQATAATD
jgi:3-methylfumaryl-CoA hydratase